MGAICGATVAVARAGLLAGKAHTSNGAEWLAGHAPDYAGIEAYIDSPRAVSDGRVVTASGLAPITFSAAIGRLVAPEAGAKHDEYLAMFAREFAD